MIYLNDNLKNFDVEAALPLLSEQRREQALKFKFEQGRKECAASYLLLCEALRKEYGLEETPVFGYGEHGKPFLAAHPDIHFNISHCREAVLCVVSNRPVGADVESVRECNESLVRYTMNDDEQKLILSAASPALEFTKLWTRKEAVLKLTGQGLCDDLKSVLENSPEVTTTVSPDGRYVYSVVY